MEAFRLGAKAGRATDRARRAQRRKRCVAQLPRAHRGSASRRCKAWALLDAKRFAQRESARAPLLRRAGRREGHLRHARHADASTARRSIAATGRARIRRAVALTRRAGGTILGKTVTAEFATFVPRATRNPHDLSRTPGGSSSGSAAAVADFMVPLAFGTQTAGSLIRPASYCGIFAYKPTFNILARGGMKPGGDSLDTIGVYGRSVEDVAFFAAALTNRARPGTDHRPRAAHRVCRTNEWEHVQPDMREAFEDAGRALGAPELKLPARFKGLRESHTAILWYEVARSLADEFQRFPEQIDPALRKRCADGFALDPARIRPRAAARGGMPRACFEKRSATTMCCIAPAATGEAPKGLASTGDVAMNVSGPCCTRRASRSPPGAEPERACRSACR